jgi:putative protein kinase ArgK-like GTPase of G3E family
MPVETDKRGAPPVVQVLTVNIDGYTVFVHAVHKKMYLDAETKKYLDSQARREVKKLWEEYIQHHKCERCELANDKQKHLLEYFWSKHNNEVLFKV